MAFSIDRKTVAIKNKLILSAHQVAKDRWNFVADHIGTNHLEPFILLVEVERRSVHHQQGLGTFGLRHSGCAREPDVLTNVKTEAHTLHLKDKRRTIGLEITLLVKDGVVREFELGIMPQYGPVFKNKCCVVDTTLDFAWITHQVGERGKFLAFFNKRIEYLLATTQKR